MLHLVTLTRHHLDNCHEGCKFTFVKCYNALHLQEQHRDDVRMANARAAMQAAWCQCQPVGVVFHRAEVPRAKRESRAPHQQS